MENFFSHVSTDSLSKFANDFITDEVIFADIETTGLSPSSSFIYCIGTAYRDSGGICVHLIFAENRNDESEVLHSFCDLLEKRNHIVTFNGTTFDIPFIKSRCIRHGICSPFEGKEHTDLLREARRIKKLLRLKSLSQKSIEHFLGCSRDDEMGGGELIPVYYRYERLKKNRDRELLLLHNSDDVKGMLHVTDILSYRKFLDGGYKITSACLDRSISGYEDNAFADAYAEAYEAGLNNVAGLSLFDSSSSIGILKIELLSQCRFPKSVYLTDSLSQIILKDTDPVIRIPIRRGFLRHYFPDFKNYYYLPDEGTIIHKSLGEFVDKSHRENASKENCYVEKECLYVKLPGSGGESYLRKSLRDKGIYAEYNDEGKDSKLIEAIVKSVLASI